LCKQRFGSTGNSIQGEATDRWNSKGGLGAASHLVTEHGKPGVREVRAGA